MKDKDQQLIYEAYLLNEGFWNDARQKTLELGKKFISELGQGRIIGIPAVADSNLPEDERRRVQGTINLVGLIIYLGLTTTMYTLLKDPTSLPEIEDEIRKAHPDVIIPEPARREIEKQLDWEASRPDVPPGMSFDEYKRIIRAKQGNNEK